MADIKKFANKIRSKLKSEYLLLELQLIIIFCVSETLLLVCVQIITCLVHNISNIVKLPRADQQPKI